MGTRLQLARPKDIWVDLPPGRRSYQPLYTKSKAAWISKCQLSNNLHASLVSNRNHTQGCKNYTDFLEVNTAEFADLRLFEMIAPTGVHVPSGFLSRAPLPPRAELLLNESCVAADFRARRGNISAAALVVCGQQTAPYDPSIAPSFHVKTRVH